MPSDSKPRPELLREIVQRDAEHLRTDLRSRLVRHPGELGRARESAVGAFLKGQLPRTLDISTGFAFDVGGRVSKQLDIVITDPSVGGAYDAGGGVNYHRVESVLAVGQVKSEVTSRKELWGAFDNLRSVTDLDRSANGRAVCMRTGQDIDHRSIHTHRVFTFLVVVGKGLRPETCRDVLCDYATSYDAHTWPSLVLFLDSHMLTFHCDDGVCPNTTHARGISLIEEDGLNIVRFVRFLADAVIVTAPAYAAHASYLPGLFPAPKSHTIYSTFHTDDEPPPFVSQWPRTSLPNYATADGADDDEDG